MSVFDVLIFAINSVLPIILLVALGYFLKIKGLFTSDFIKIGNKTVFRLLLPVLLFVNIAQMESFSQIDMSAIGFAFVVITILLLVGIVMACFIKDKRQKGVVIQAVFRSNFALIGVPLSELIAGSEGVQAAALLSAFSIPTYNILGVIVLSIFVQENANISWGKKIKGILIGICKNPLIIGVFLGIVFVTLKPVFYLLPAEAIELVGKFSFLTTALNYLAKAATPMALLVLGGQFEFSVIKDLKKQIIFGTIGRLLIGPLVGIGGAVLLQMLGLVSFSAGVYASYVALFVTPVAVASAIMAEEMHNDGQLAAQIVVWTTIFSSVIIFLVVMLLRALGMV